MKPFFECNAIEQADFIMDVIKQRQEKRIPLVKENAQDSFEDLKWKLKEVDENKNPIPVPPSTRLRFFKRVVGRVIRTFTRGQVNFNHSTAAYLALVANHFRQVNEQLGRVESRVTSVQEQIVLPEIRVRNLETTVSDIGQSIASAENSLSALENTFERTLAYHLESESKHEVFAEKLDTTEGKLTQLIETSTQKIEHVQSEQQNMWRELSRLNQWLESLELSHKNLNGWVTLISERDERLEKFQDRTRKELFLELDRRLQKPVLKPSSSPQKFQIINAEKYNRAVASQNIKLNLGCGTITFPDYINVDFRALEGVDVAADVTDLPFAEKSVSELYLAHLIEHFTEDQMDKVILPYWLTLLKVGGRIRVVCPNWSAMIREHVSGTVSFEGLREVTFGSQEYEGNFHFNMYTPETLRDVLTRAGFVNVHVIVEERMNGQCLEMEMEGERGQ